MITIRLKRAVVKVVILVPVLFFLLPSFSCYENVPEHQVKENENNQTTGIILSYQHHSKEISGRELRSALEIESSTNKTLFDDKEAFTKHRTFEDDSREAFTDYTIADYRNVVDLQATGVFTATSGGPYLINFLDVNKIGSGSRIISAGTSMALLLVNGIVRATSYANPGERNIASISTVVTLERGDRVHILVTGIALFVNNATDDDDYYYAQFHGIKIGLNK